jgi:hypothetical protein
MGLVDAGVAEAFDLDFKQELYGRTDADKRALATDVAALANTAGGIIVLGVEEDDQARATATPGVTLSDDEERRIRQVVAAGVAPVPAFDVIAVPDDPDATHGFYVLAVERTQAAPHAVLVNDGFRYPRRNGATTRYLSEPEVAEAYRARLAGLAGQRARVEQVWRDGTAALDTTEEAWVAVALVPDVLGAFRVNRAASRRFEKEARERLPTVVNLGFQTWRTSVGRGFLAADGTSGGGSSGSRWFRYELHADGAGFFAVGVGWLRRGQQGQMLESPSMAVDDEHLTIGVLSALVRLGSHSRDSAAASGSAAIRAGLYGLRPDAPASLSHQRGHFGRDTYNDREVSSDPPPVDTMADLDAIATVGPDVISVAAHICDRLAQSFAVAELGQFSDDGRIRERYVSDGPLAQLKAWAGDSVEFVMATLEDQ